jgi:hypothetical protein
MADDGYYLSGNKKLYVAWQDQPDTTQAKGWDITLQ